MNSTLSMLLLLGVASSLTGCATIGTDGKLCTGLERMTHPERCGTEGQRTAWAKADLCVQVCDARHPNDKMVLAARVGNDCVCQTTHVYMGASYYGDDHAPEPVDQYERVKLPATFEESVAQVDAAVKALANASCVVKAREQLQQKQRIE